MKLILDFDDVLFNARDFKRILFERLEGYFKNLKNFEHFSVDDIRARYDAERLKDTPFSLKSFLKNIFEEVHESSIGVSIIYDEVMSHCRECINHDLVSVVQKIGKENCFIITSGDREFQNEKIVRTELGTIVTRAIIVPGGKSAQIESICQEFSDEDIIFVDDKNKYFTDINMEVCKNLKTVLYNENHGLTNLTAELEESKMEEQKRTMQQEQSNMPTPPMR